MKKIKLRYRCEKKLRGEQCILVGGHKGNCQRNWITQKQLNRRLVKCGYGYSLYPANWWTEEHLEKVERFGETFKRLEKEIGRKITTDEYWGFTRGHKLYPIKTLRNYCDILFREGKIQVPLINQIEQFLDLFEKEWEKNYG